LITLAILPVVDLASGAGSFELPARLQAIRLVGSATQGNKREQPDYKSAPFEIGPYNRGPVPDRRQSHQLFESHEAQGLDRPGCRLSSRTRAIAGGIEDQLQDQAIAGARDQDDCRRPRPGRLPAPETRAIVGIREQNGSLAVQALRSAWSLS